MSRNVAASHKRAWIALAAALIFHTGLISLQSHQRVDRGFVRVWILDLLAPVEKLTDRALLSVHSVWDNYISLVEEHEENVRLRYENDSLRMQLMQEKEQILEAQRIRALAGMADSHIGKSVIARVIGRDPARSQTVTIDKGAVDGLRPDSAVITAEGIVGRVIHSSNHFSIVQLIVDSQSAVGVMLETTRQRGILNGMGTRDLALDYIDDDNDLKDGDTFLTSGEDRIYPKGLIVGTITQVGPRKGLLKAVQVRPAADLSRLEEVLCLIDFSRSAEIGDPVQAVPAP
jgi:rod shape-determining protein MreC